MEKVNNFEYISTDNMLCKVSSVLNNDAANYGKQCLFEDDERCWCSSEGESQFIFIKFKEETRFSGFQIQFQGGFGSDDIQLVIEKNERDISLLFHPEDSNKLQQFILEEPLSCQNIKIYFKQCTDTYGRMIVYLLRLLKS